MLVYPTATAVFLVPSSSALDDDRDCDDDEDDDDGLFV